VGSPDVRDDVTLWGLLLPIRQVLDQYVNLRPVRLMPGVEGPLREKGPEDIEMICVRENSEGEYSPVGGRVHQGLSHEVGIQTDVFTREGVERIARQAFELASTRRGKLTSVTKSNAGRHAFVFWDDVVASVATDYPDVELERILVDAAAAYLVTRPESFDVVVGSNLFMDVLTDLGAAIQGGMGLAASANLNPGGDVPGMFEPVHGSAPNIAGTGVANPIGAVWAGR
jgi:tartrate dehydrogenase/decarboxylase / D-malate dehydrogenase